jgi:hypothetical protein
MSSTSPLGDNALDSGNNSAVDEVEFTRFLDYKLLENLSKKEGSLTNSQTNTSASSAPSAALFYNHQKRHAPPVEVKLADSGSSYELDFDQDVFDHDVLSSLEPSSIPEFGIGFTDQTVLGEEEPFVFEYWIEDINL